MSMPRRMAVLAAAVLVTATAVPSCSRLVPGHSTTSPSPPPAASAPVTPTPAPPTVPPSDDDQVRQTVMSFQDAYNTQKWDVYLDLMCTAMRDGFTDRAMEQLKTTRAEQGLTNVAVTDVDVEGDDATATVDAQNEMLGRRTIQLTMTRENGWKVCQTTPVR